jgi:Fe2+ transport system protein FeoA
MKTLRDVQIGETSTVVKIHGSGALKRRIMDMGITKRNRDFGPKGGSAWGSH